MVKHENRPPPCHVRPNPAKLRGNRFVQSTPCPWTPLDLTNIIFRPVLCQFFGFFGFFSFSVSWPKFLKNRALWFVPQFFKLKALDMPTPPQGSGLERVEPAPGASGRLAKVPPGWEILTWQACQGAVLPLTNRGKN